MEKDPNTHQIAELEQRIADKRKAAWQQLQPLAGDDSKRVQRSATELLRTHPNWTPQQCLEAAREYHRKPIY